MSLSVGIVGLPNVGKSTLFNALLKKQQALAANYPFATIEPNVGIVQVPDERLGKLAEVVGSGQLVDKGEGSLPLSQAEPEVSPSGRGRNIPQVVPAAIEFVDIAGLVAGAAGGEGLGNQFLAHIREVDLVCHVLRAFEDGDVVLTGKMDPVEDLKTVRMELILKDLESIENKIGNSKHEMRNNIKFANVLNKLKDGLGQGLRAAEILESEESDEAKGLFLLTMKPEIFVINVSEVEAESSKLKAESYSQQLGVSEENIVMVSAKVEAELVSLSDEDQGEYLAELGLEVSGIERMAQAAYSKLGLISFLTAGEKECRAWTIREGAKAAQAAGVIHTDFEKKFIKADVIGWRDFVELGGWKQAREVGKVRQEGKEYVVRDGDVVEFKIGS